MPQHHMVLPHYMGRSRDIDIERKISEVNPEEISRKDSFSPQTPPDDIPLLLPYEAIVPDSSTMESKSNGLNSSDYYATELSGHCKGSSFSYQDSKRPTSYQDIRYSFIDNHDTANLQSAALVEAVPESDLQVKDNWLEAQQQTFQVISTNEVTQVGPHSLCHCQVSFKNIESLLRYFCNCSWPELLW